MLPHRCRYYTQKRLARAAAKLGHTAVLTVHDQFEDRRTGVRMCTFVSSIQHLAGGGQVCGIEMPLEAE